MRVAGYLNHESELPHLTGFSEVIIGIREISRRGSVGMSEALVLAKSARAQGLRVALEWDALIEERRFASQTKAISKIASEFDVIRVRDAGAAIWVRDELTLPIQLLLEAGHHNLLALQTWQERLGSRLERLCVSPEIPLPKLKEWKGILATPMEILALGPLLLFHSPRSLLKTVHAADSDELFAIGASEESPHKGFPLQENAHGTLMFHPKDLCLLERWEHLSFLDVLRLDHRGEAQGALALIGQFLATPDAHHLDQLKAGWSKEWMRGYLDVNKSDVLFPKLKNSALSARDGALCAEVIEAKRKGWIAIKATGEGLSVGEECVVTNPQGEKRAMRLTWMKDAMMKPVEHILDGEVGFIPWMGGTPSGSQILKK